MTDKTLSLLRKAGWAENRIIGTLSYENILKGEGDIVNDVIRDFLRNFGGIDVIHPHHRVETSQDEFYIDPERAVAKVYMETVKEYEDRVGEFLVVGGMCFREHMVILLSHTGRMYAGYDETLLKLGNSTIQGLIALCEGIGITGVESIT